MGKIQAIHEGSDMVPPEILLSLLETFGRRWATYNRTPITLDEVFYVGKKYGVTFEENKFAATFLRSGRHIITYVPGLPSEKQILVLGHELSHVILAEEGYAAHLKKQEEEFLCHILPIQALMPLHQAIPKDALDRKILPDDFVTGSVSPPRFLPFVPATFRPVDAWRWCTARANVYNTAHKACTRRCRWDHMCFKCPYGKLFFKGI